MVDYVITLVHGTFAHGASWIRDDSPLPSKLRAAGKGRFLTFPFRWSGRNTHEARIAAGRDLARCILHRTKQYPTARQVVIAHSHAGNVALYAASASQIPELRIITLGTPFIRAESRQIEPVFKMLVLAMGTIVTFAFILCGLIVAGMILQAIPHNYDQAPVNILPFAAGVLYVTLLVWVLYGLAGTRSGVDIVGDWVVRTAFPAIETRQNALTDELTATCSSRHNLLVVSVEGDEAARALSALDLIAKIPSTIIGLLAAIAGFIAAIGQAIKDQLLPAANVAGSFPVLQAPIFFCMIVLAAGPLACFLLSLPVFLFGIVRRAGYWDDRLSDYAIADIDIVLVPHIAWRPFELEALSRKPDSSPICRIVYPSRSALGSLLFQHILQHCSLYERDDIADGICSWLVHNRLPSSGCHIRPSCEDEEFPFPDEFGNGVTIRHRARQR